MRSQAQVVIIGGGIVGCSIAYHLTALGWKDIVLLEKGELTSGTTFHSVGLVSQFRTSPTLMRLMNYSINLYDRFQKESGGTMGWNKVGSLRLASSMDQLKKLQHEASTAKALGLKVDLISAQEAKKIFPPMSIDSLYGAVYIPDDGWLEPNGITQEFAQRAARQGVEILTNVRVTGIRQGPHGEMTAVETPLGDIQTNIVVNAAGQWAPQIAAMVGVDHIPITPIMHQFLLTRPIPGHELPSNTPVVRDPDNLVYIREEVGGYLVGGFERNPKAWSPDGVSWAFTEQLLAPEWDLFDELMEGAIRRVPVLETAEVIRLVNGPEGITPDGKYCLGPLPGVRGFYIAAGMSLNGIAGAGGVGKILAEWIVEGHPSWDMRELNVRRFGKHFSERNFRIERTREMYKYYYLLHYPEDEYEWGRPLRASALFEKMKALGAVFGEKNGWERVNYFDPDGNSRSAGADQHQWGWTRPPYFAQVAREHHAVREHAGILDMSSFGKIDVKGPGALKFLQRMTDNNVDKPVGSVIYTQFLNSHGGIESDVTVTRWGETLFRITCGTASLSNDLGWIRMHMPDNDTVKAEDVTEDWNCLALWGPQARKILSAVTSADISNGSFPYMQARVIHINKVKVWAQRLSYAGELGWELYMHPQDALGVFDSLMDAGKSYGLMPIGYKALNSLRLEKGYRVWGSDITPDENPYTAGMGYCARLNSGGDFIGKEALLLARKNMQNYRICTLTSEEEGCVIYGGEALYKNGKLVGRVRSGGYGHTVQKNIAIAGISNSFTQIGSILEMDYFDSRLPVEVAPDVLYDPEMERLKA